MKINTIITFLIALIIQQTSLAADSDLSYNQFLQDQFEELLKLEKDDPKVLDPLQLQRIRVRGRVSAGLDVPLISKLKIRTQIELYFDRVSQSEKVDKSNTRKELNKNE